MTPPASNKVRDRPSYESIESVSAANWTSRIGRRTINKLSALGTPDLSRNDFYPWPKTNFPAV
jgi:hypothetical protein